MKPIQNISRDGRFYLGDKVVAIHNGLEVHLRTDNSERTHEMRVGGTVFDYFAGETGVIIGVKERGRQVGLVIKTDDGRLYTGAAFTNWERVE